MSDNVKQKETRINNNPSNQTPNNNENTLMPFVGRRGISIFGANALALSGLATASFYEVDFFQSTHKLFAYLFVWFICFSGFIVLGGIGDLKTKMITTVFEFLLIISFSTLTAVPTIASIWDSVKRRGPESMTRSGGSNITSASPPNNPASSSPSRPPFKLDITPR